MKLAFTVSLPKREQRLKSPAWNRFTQNVDRARLNMKIKRMEKRNETR